MIKQVIVVRKDLGMRKGKMIAQGAHASVNAYRIAKLRGAHDIIELWNATGYTKICVGVDSDKELLDIFNKALEYGFPTAIIVDSGRTEFRGEPTRTAVAIGPASSEGIDEITGHLELL